ncbi:hypothetical protein L6259_01480 [Candidatus Parcubacteria bacterium]|nr:hypothetical protein [Patescibacteria group bacterium]MCG2693936.1 hypothetical protein [Candidatus Parcubacteria bacterium]
MKHLFYSLLITFALLAGIELFRPNFATNFFNINWLFLALVVSGVLALTRRQKLDKV